MERVRRLLLKLNEPLGIAIIKLVSILLMIAALCWIGKYVFFENCISILQIHDCTSSTGIGNDSLVAIAALLVAVITLIPLFTIEDRVSAAKKEVEQRVYARLEKNLDLVPQAYYLLQQERESLSEFCFGDALYFAISAADQWPRYKQEALRLIGREISKYLVLYGPT